MIKVLSTFDNMLFSSMNKYARFYESQILFRLASDYNLEKGKLEYEKISLDIIYLGYFSNKNSQIIMMIPILNNSFEHRSKLLFHKDKDKES